ncbi:MAG: PorP/SprF family type IX secretion system membrane protein [Bacteroidia bacterium]
MLRYIKHIKVALLVLITAGASAQQLPQYSQYMLNDFTMNPAIAGRNNFWEAKSNNRYQWVGITDAPRTYILSLQGPFKNLKMGIGGNIFTDIVGPTRRTGFNMAYAYHIKLSSTYKLSFGLNAGVLQYSVDGSKITAHDQGDPIMSPNYQSALAPDLGAGTYLYSDKLTLSLGFPQIYQANIKFFNYQTTKNSVLAHHFYGLAGYKLKLSDDLSLTPMVLVKYVQPAPVELDGGLKFSYQEKFWIGLNYRGYAASGFKSDAATFLVGYMFKEWMMFGYSYDYTMSALKKYNTGTHEVMLGLRFMPPKKKE